MSGVSQRYDPRVVKEKERRTAATWTVWLVCRGSSAWQRPFSGGLIPASCGAVIGVYKTQEEAQSFSRRPIDRNNRLFMPRLYDKPIAWLAQRAIVNRERGECAHYVSPNYGGPVLNADEDQVLGVFRTREDALAFMKARG